MEFLLFAIFFFAVLIPLVLGSIIPIYRHHSKATDGVINYDATMRKFVYKVDLSSEEIINRLKTRNDGDELSCTVDLDRTVINFSDYGSHREYYFQIQEHNGFSVLRLEQVAVIGMQSHIPYKLNPFIIDKLRAEIIPYSDF